MPVSDEDVRYVARLGRLELNNEEVSVYAEQMKKILDYFKLLDEIDTRGIEPMAHVQPLQNILREDIVTKCSCRDSVLSASPQSENGLFKVPPIWEEE